MVMKLLSSFHDLNSLIRASKIFSLIFKSNQYGVCEVIARSQFRETWDDTNKLLHHQRRVGQLCHAEPCVRTPSLTAGDKEGSHEHDHGKCNKKPGVGIFEGGTKVGLAEATRLMKFTKRCSLWRKLVKEHIFIDYSWEHISRGIPVSEISISETCSIAPQESLRIDKAIIRYYLLVLACAPDWVDERKKYNLLFSHYNIFSIAIAPVETGDRASMTQQELLDRKRRRADLFLQYQIQEIRDIYVVCKATTGCWSQLPGTMQQGADHTWEQWTNIDDACVQQEAEIHIKRVWRIMGMDSATLLGPDIFFEELEV